MADRIQLRRDTAANWTAVNPTLAQGEVGYEANTGQFKFGDGATAWTGLSYFSPTPAVGVNVLSGVAGINTVTANGNPSIAAYPSGLFVCTFANANTGAVTLNVDGVGAASLLDPSGAALASGAYAAGVPYLLLCNATNFRFFASF
jgi:hypothetical protein